MTELAPADEELLGLGCDEIAARARARRDAVHGRRVTFSPKVFIPLTMLCRDRCGYCTFAKPPARLSSPLPRLSRSARGSVGGVRVNVGHGSQVRQSPIEVPIFCR